jgi:ribonuclease-3
MNVLPSNATTSIQLDDDIRIEKNPVNGQEIYVFDPYNPLNVQITPQEIEELLSKYGLNIRINNFELYKRAFINKSYIRHPQNKNVQNNITIAPKPDNCLPLYTKSNERLEFLGDGMLECICKFSLYRRFPKENEGFMTEKKIALVKNESIGRLALEMGLNRWFILSKHAESKQVRTNLKKLGCLFESFIGALFLDMNKIEVRDEEGWFQHVFMTGPGFQIVQIFIENIFERHVDWVKLIENDDNYKNILQELIQKEFKTTPHYAEIQEHHTDFGYNMGVYLCLGQPIFGLRHQDAVPITQIEGGFEEIHRQMSITGRVFIFLGGGKHKIKKKAEQIACDSAIRNMGR